MVHTLSDVIKKSKRINAKENNNLHPFATRFSIYFSWLFINLGFSANTVTFIFFIIGVISAISLLFNSLFAVLISYFLFRLHIIIDVSDGEVARYNNTLSINGSYWDSIIHLILYPLIFLCMCFSQYLNYDDNIYLLISPIGVLVICLTLSVTNNYYKSMLFNDVDLNDIQNKETKKYPKRGYKFIFFSFLSEVLSFEGLYIFYIFLYLINETILILPLLIIYVFFFLLKFIVKFYSLSKYGFYYKRN